MHHDEPVAMGNGVLHVVGDHHGGQILIPDDAVGGVQHLLCGLGVQCRRVLVQQQQLGLAQGGHEQGQCLTLAAGEQTDLGGQTVFQTQIQFLQQFPVVFPLCLGDAPLQATTGAAASGQSQVFVDAQDGSGAGHGVLEHTAQVCGALVLGHAGDVLTVDEDGAFVHRPHAGHGVQGGGFTGAVAADDGAEIPVV